MIIGLIVFFIMFACLFTYFAVGVYILYKYSHSFDIWYEGGLDSYMNNHAMKKIEHVHAPLPAEERAYLRNKYGLLPSEIEPPEPPAPKPYKIMIPVPSKVYFDDRGLPVVEPQPDIGKWVYPPDPEEVQRKATWIEDARMEYLREHGSPIPEEMELKFVEDANQKWIEHVEANEKAKQAQKEKGAAPYVLGPMTPIDFKTIDHDGFASIPGLGNLYSYLARFTGNWISLFFKKS